MRTCASSWKEQIAIGGMIAVHLMLAHGFGFLEAAPITLQFPYLFIGVLLGTWVHEYAHGLTAHLLGFRKPANEGRLTLNPLVHLHPLGTLAILTLGIGWGRPIRIADDESEVDSGRERQCHPGSAAAIESAVSMAEGESWS